MILRLIFFILKITLTIFVISFIYVSYTIYISTRTLPSITQLENYHPPSVSRIYSQDGKLMQELSREKRIFIPITAIPQQLIYAFIAAEDKNFYKHNGIDLTSITRALIANISHIATSTRVEGGSTITQQVVKNFLLNSERSLERKIKEAILSYMISNSFSKDKILELYLNQIYLGKGAYGIASAALIYFNKSVEELNLNECATLAALPKAPSKYNPINNYERSLRRRNYVLNRMYDDGYIAWKQLHHALRKPIALFEFDPIQTLNANYYAEKVRGELIEMFGEEYLYSAGLTVITCADSRIQENAQNALRSRIDQIKDNDDDLNGAIIVMEHRTGRVLAMQGGYDFKKSKFDRATQAKRQIGSLIKPFVYLSAFEQGLKPNDIIIDGPIELDQGPHLEQWKPRNYERNFLGPMTVRMGLEKSRNTVTVRVGRFAGFENIARTIQKFRINDEPKPYGSIVLGSLESTLSKMVTAYSAIANGGYKTEPHYIELVKDREGNVIYKRDYRESSNSNDHTTLPVMKSKLAHDKIVDKDLAYQITSIMAGSRIRGTGRGTRHLRQNIACKTGTTNNAKDTWFVGFTPAITVGTYIGYDSPRSLGEKASGAKIALPVFIDFMKNTYGNSNVGEFTIPKSVVIKRINYKTGVPDQNSNRTDFIEEVFRIDDIESDGSISPQRVIE